MSEAYAWLLALGGELYAATGERELRYLLADKPHLITIPKTPGYCNKVFVWQGAVVPVMDVAQRILGREVVRNASEELIVLATFRAHPEAPLQHGALLLEDIPIRIHVNDAQACALPEPRFLWQRLAQSCFEHEKCGVVPVLDLVQVFLMPADPESAE